MIKKDFKKEEEQKYLVSKNKKYGVEYITQSQIEEFYNEMIKNIHSKYKKGVQFAMGTGGNLFDGDGYEQETSKLNEPCPTKFIGDTVNHPAHYADSRIEVIDYIEDKNLGFCLGNAIKYISRAGKKQDYKNQDQKTKTIEDLQKAIWYIYRRIEEIKEDKCD